jgi:hypothetical protein
VELEGRFATVTKNLLNMKTLIAGSIRESTAIRHGPPSQPRQGHAPEDCRPLSEKYELSTLRIDDFKLAITYLSSEETSFAARRGEQRGKHPKENRGMDSEDGCRR